MMPRSRKRWIATLLLGIIAGIALIAAALAVTVATSGVFAARRGDWTTRVVVAPHAALAVNVPALLRLATSPAGRWLLDGRSRATSIGALRFRRVQRTLVVRCAPCRLKNEQLHSGPVTFDAIELRLTPRADGLLDGTLASGAVQAAFTATVRADGIDVAWSLPPTEIAALYRALGSAIPEARFARIDGLLTASGTLKLPTMIASTRVDLDGFAVDGLGTEQLQYGRFEFACRTAGGLPNLVACGDDEKGWLPLDKLGPWLAPAVIAAEDQRFHTHAGFDDAEIAQALVATSARGPVRGASTLTQQLARTLFTGAERTAVRKLRELLYAVEMERTLGKPRILALYLNTTDWGPGICGARSAARTYFGKPPAKLTPLEAAWLASILRNPHLAYERQFRAAQPNTESAQQVLAQMRQVPRRQRARWAGQPLVFAPVTKTATASVSQVAQRSGE